MFGYVLTDSKRLSEQEKEIYRSCYCGLCKALPVKCKMTLNYDMAFLILVLSSVYQNKCKTKKVNCLLHPTKHYSAKYGEICAYAADMNIILSYYNLMDNWHDDKSIISVTGAEILKKEFQTASERYPQKAEIIARQLKELSKIEAENITEPDIPAECFGKIMGELFSPYKDDKSEKLMAFGNALGKFIYLLDACIDLKKDIKNKKYNPLVMFSESDFEEILCLLLSDCTDEYKNLGISENNGIIENILYSGIWTRFEVYKQKETKKHDSGSV